MSKSPRRARKKAQQEMGHNRGNVFISDDINIDSEFIMPHAPTVSHLDMTHELHLDDTRDNPGVRGKGMSGDWLNVILLTFLYVLQGIPLGLAGSIPMILQSRSISYKQQAMFSFVYWPFSIKLFWAPIVDAVYSKRFGRRKSWMVPSQYLIGISMIILSYNISAIMDIDPPSVLLLTCIFMFINFLAATQDIAVDGWALTMLSRRNVGLASTCNSVGQTAGYFLGNVVFLALESADFCNSYLRTEAADTGIVTLSGFLYFWGLAFLVMTTIVMLIKKEAKEFDDDIKQRRGSRNLWQDVLAAYRQFAEIVKLPAVKELAFVLVTHKIGFSAADAVTGLKLMEAGMPKEKLALMAIPLTPIQILLPLVISRFTAGPKPLSVFKRAMAPRLLIGVAFAGLVYMAHSIQSVPGEFPAYYYCLILAIYSLHQVALYCQFVAIMSFFAQISDPIVGGTYMTLLNTLSNLGGKWTTTVALWLVDPLTWKHCDGGKRSGESCDTELKLTECTDAEGQCGVTADGYYIESVVCLVIGLLWLKFQSHRIDKLQKLSHSAWKCRASNVT